MSTENALVEHKRRRGYAKGSLTIKALQSTDLNKLKHSTINKRVDTLKGANESFNIHHTATFETLKEE